MQRDHFTDEHDMFREAFRTFLDREMVPHREAWTEAEIVDRDVFAKAGASGFLAMAVPEQYGGAGVDDFRYSQVIVEELTRADLYPHGLGMTLHSDVCLPYFLDYTTDEQKQRWLPGIASGELITAVKTDPSQRHKGMSLLVLERGMEGFERGRNLDKVGMHAQDTAELFFTDVRVPVANRLGDEGQGFVLLVKNLPQERLSIAAAAVAHCRAMLTWTIDYAKERTAFGQPIGTFQNSRFKLAEMETEVTIAETFVDRCVELLNDGRLTAEEASMAKWWTTELQKRVADTGMQLHGGYGYMNEYPIARAWTDARITSIYGGTTEIMKEIIGRDLGL